MLIAGARQHFKQPKYLFIFRLLQLNCLVLGAVGVRCFLCVTKTSNHEKITAVIAAVLVLTLSAFGFDDVWKAEKFRANPGFSITRMGISEAAGNFKKYDAGMHASIADFSDAVFVMSADVASINTEFTLMRNNRVSGNFAVLQTARVAQPGKAVQRKKQVNGLLNSGLWFWS